MKVLALSFIKEWTVDGIQEEFDAARERRKIEVLKIEELIEILNENYFIGNNKEVKKIIEVLENHKKVVLKEIDDLFDDEEETINLNKKLNS